MSSDSVYLCQICHKQHKGIYGSGRFCGVKCASRSRKKNRAKTIAKQKKQGIQKLRKILTPTVSRLQQNVSSLLSQHGVVHSTQFQLGKYYFDIKIDNVLLQVQGDYWHANPTKYQFDTVISYPGNKRKRANTIWKRDLRKKLYATKLGYKVIYVWQQEYHKNKPEKLYQLLVLRMNNQNQSNII